MATTKQRRDSKKSKEKASRSRRRKNFKRYATKVSREPMSPRLMVPIVLPVEAWISLLAAGRTQHEVPTPKNRSDDQVAKDERNTKTLALAIQAGMLQLQEAVARHGPGKPGSDGGEGRTFLFLNEAGEVPESVWSADDQPPADAGSAGDPNKPNAGPAGSSSQEGEE